MTLKFFLLLLVLTVGNASALPLDSYTIWVDGDKVSIADVHAEVVNVNKGEMDNLNLLLNETVIRQLDFACGRFEQIKLLQTLIQYSGSQPLDPRVETIYKSRIDYLLKWEETYPKVKDSEESCAVAREVFEQSCIKLIWELNSKSYHLGRAEKMLRIKHLLDNNFVVYPLQADLWRLMISISVRDHLSVDISEESIDRLLTIDDKNKDNLFRQVLEAVNSMCKLIEDDGFDSYKKCEHYELWIRFRDIYSIEDNARSGSARVLRHFS